MSNEAIFWDFDDAEGEVAGDRWADVQFGGEHFKINLNVDGGSILRWMRLGSSSEAIPKLLEIFFPDQSDFERLLDVGAPWAKYEALGLKLVAALSGSDEDSSGKD